MTPRIGWYKRSAWMEEFRPDGLGHIVISGGSEPPKDIAFTEIVCDCCNADAGAARDDGREGVIFFDGSDSLCVECGREAERSLLADLIANIKATAFIEGYGATDPQAMGLLVALFFRWDGLAILRAAQFALEDVNFHGESARVADMADAVEKGDGDTPHDHVKD